MLRFALVALLAIACTKSDTDTTDDNEATASNQAAAGESRDACALITKQETDSILGFSVTSEPGTMSPEQSECAYSSDAGGGFQTFVLKAYWTGGEEQLEIARRAAGIATDVSGGSQDEIVAGVMGLQAVKGLGDEAYFSRRIMSYVRKGDVALEFQVSGLNEPARERWEGLVRAALNRI